MTYPSQQHTKAGGFPCAMIGSLELPDHPLTDDKEAHL